MLSTLVVIIPLLLQPPFLALSFTASLQNLFTTIKVNNNQSPNIPYGLLFPCLYSCAYFYLEGHFSTLPVEILLILQGPIQITPPPELYTSPITLKYLCNCVSVFLSVK